MFDDSGEGCIDDKKTYIINFHAHIQKEIQDAIVSIATKSNNESVVNGIIGQDGELAVVTATKSYLGTLIDEINEDLYKYKVQINLVLDPQEIDMVSSSGQYDPSCEMVDPVKNMTKIAYDSLVQQFNDSVGIHFYMYGCIFDKGNNATTEIIRKGKCGRVVGVMWRGSNLTKNLLKSAIVEAITETKNAYETGSLNLPDKSGLCRFSEKCIGELKSPLGMVLPYLSMIKYTSENEPVSSNVIDII